LARELLQLGSNKLVAKNARIGKDRHYIRLTDEDLRRAMDQDTAWYEIQNGDQSSDHRKEKGQDMVS